MDKTKYVAFLLFAVAIIIAIALSLSRSTQATPQISSTSTAAYVGSTTCQTCHASTYSTWNLTNHANMAGILEINASGTYYWVSTLGHRPYNQSAFVNSCASCHVTGWNATTKTWPNWDSTDPVVAASFLNAQCELCHGPGSEHITAPTTTPMIINYSATLCGQCHTGGRQYDDWNVSPHKDSYATLNASSHAGDSCLRCMTTQGSLGQSVFLNTTGLEPVGCATCHDPHSVQNASQLRANNSTILCGTCHNGFYQPQSDFFATSPHTKAGLECTDCHGPGTKLSHGSPSAVVNHTWAIYGTFYPYNQTDTLVCTSCHTEEWSNTQLGVIQDLTEEMITNATKAIDDAKLTITNCNQTLGVNMTAINQASSMVSTAEHNLNYVQNDRSTGFHNPEMTYGILTDVANSANEAGTIALNARAEALDVNVTSLQIQVNSLQNQTDTQNADIQNLNAKVDSLQSQVATGPYMYGGIGLAIGFVVGAAIVFGLRKRKP